MIQTLQDPDCQLIEKMLMCGSRLRVRMGCKAILFVKKNQIEIAVIVGLTPTKFPHSKDHQLTNIRPTRVTVILRLQGAG